jgi:hypothetical protein
VCVAMRGCLHVSCIGRSAWPLARRWWQLRREGVIISLQPAMQQWSLCLQVHVPKKSTCTGEGIQVLLLLHLWGVCVCCFFRLAA